MVPGLGKALFSFLLLLPPVRQPGGLAQPPPQLHAQLRASPQAPGSHIPHDTHQGDCEQSFSSNISHHLQTGSPTRGSGCCHMNVSAPQALIFLPLHKTSRCTRLPLPSPWSPTPPRHLMGRGETAWPLPNADPMEGEQQGAGSPGLVLCHEAVPGQPGTCCDRQHPQHHQHQAKHRHSESCELHPGLTAEVTLHRYRLSPSIFTHARGKTGTSTCPGSRL